MLGVTTRVQGEGGTKVDWGNCIKIVYLCICSVYKSLLAPRKFCNLDGIFRSKKNSFLLHITCTFLF